jgi:class 3 adenylate cyclase/tetratricopeptide (TPR) repeat protein
VSVLFCDLVGFTSQAESMDPEDVEAILRPYHARVRTELERHGGTVEKFIGDAVMALFGAPTAHEDDPERAVRAALAIRDFALEEGLELRVGITTGEALVSLDANPAGGEAMASGDVVNTAARLQAAAPVNGILTDETTYRATRHVVEYDVAPEIEAKGKSRPIRVWRALEARARFGADIAHEARAGLVGRERELSVLRDAFERARHERTPQLVTLVGVPGIGKSRLVYELSRIADADPELITWRQGRCLAYGDGVTLWALGEIVKAEAGIVEQEAPAEIAAKIRRAVDDVLADEGDARWVESHLLVLAGVAVETELGGDRTGEAFAAWRRFLEVMAEQRPLVVVFEDLHWADETLLDFVDELVDWVTEVPLLVVGTARPELLERRPGWGGGKLNATTLALSPLSDNQTALLIARLLERPVLGADLQQALLERAGGNPLYAEQFAELFLERGSTDELPLPETLQGIIAARLDGLSQCEKELLRDAAVVGKVFWTGALRREAEDTAATLHSLERKGFVRRQKRTSVEGESEFAFAHALVRDVAYSQIARADRVQKHRATAEWIEELGRPEDHAEMLVHHYRTALELARSAGTDIVDLGDRTRVVLRAAGDRSFSLNAFPAAVAYYEDALALWPENDPGRPALLFSVAHASHVAGNAESVEALEEARDASLATGEHARAAEAEALLAEAWWHRGRQDAVLEHVERATALLAETPPSAAAARVYEISGRYLALAGRFVEALEPARRALEIAESLELPALQVDALTTLGLVKMAKGDDPSGVADVERALDIGRKANLPAAARAANNLANDYWYRGDLSRGAELWDESLDMAERFGNRGIVRFSQGIHVWMLIALGDWEGGLAFAEALIAECEEGSPHYMESSARSHRGELRIARGDRDGGLADLQRAAALAREAKDPQMLIPILSRTACALWELDLADQARAFAVEAISAAQEHPRWGDNAGPLAAYAHEFGVAEQLRDVLLASARGGPWIDGDLAVLDGDFGRAAAIYAEMGNVTAAAASRLRAAEHLLTAGRRAEGEAELEKALAFYRSVGATLYIERGEALRTGAQSRSA